MKKWFLLALQAVVSISLLVWIFGKQDFREQALELLESADHSWLWLGFAVAGLVNLLGAFRWGIFLRVVGIPISVWETIRLSWIGLFFNSFLVGAVGGDAVKVVWLSARGHKKFPALLSVLMDRMSGLGAIVLASLVFMTLRMDWLTQSPVVARLINVVYIYLAVVVFLVVLSFVMSMKGVTNRLPNLPGKQRLLEFLSVYIEFIVCWRQTLAASLLSVVIMCAHFYTFYCCARAFGVVLPSLIFSL